jgi:hypothetical protein
MVLGCRAAASVERALLGLIVAVFAPVHGVGAGEMLVNAMRHLVKLAASPFLICTDDRNRENLFQQDFSRPGEDCLFPRALLKAGSNSNSMQ